MHFLKTLLRFGLNPKEAKIYLKALELGPIPASTLSRQTTIPRVHVYSLLKNLLKRGIMGKFNKNKITYFCSIEPEVFLNICQDEINECRGKAQEIEEFIEYFKNSPLKKVSSTNVTFIEGRESINNLLRDLLKDSSSIRIFGNFQKSIILFPDKFKSFYSKINSQKSCLKIISASPLEKESIFFINKSELNVKKMKEDLNFECLMISCSKKIILILLRTSSPSGIILKSPEIFKMINSMFDTAWDSN